MSEKEKPGDSEASEERASALELYQGLLVERQLDPNDMALERMRTYPGYWVKVSALLALIPGFIALVPPDPRAWVLFAATFLLPAVLALPVAAALDQVEVDGRRTLRGGEADLPATIGDSIPGAICMGILLWTGSLACLFLTWFLAPLALPAWLLLGLWAPGAWLRYLGERLVFGEDRTTAMGRGIFWLSPLKPAWARTRRVWGRRSGLAEAVVANGGMIAFLVLLHAMVLRATTARGALVLGYLIHVAQALVLCRFMISWTYLFLGHDPERLTPDAGVAQDAGEKNTPVPLGTGVSGKD